MNIYISNLGFAVQDDDLKKFFTPYGEVTSAKIINDRETGRSRGFGFVEMSDDTASQKAIAELDGTTIEGRTMKVMESKPKESRSSGGSSRGGGDSYNNGNSYNKNRY